MAIDTKLLKEMTKNLNVLFVEDDAVVQMLTKQILEVFFNDLVVTNNGQEGLDVYISSLKNGQSHFDIVITDVSMPKLSGIEMARKMVELNPDQNFIFISAHQDNDYEKELEGKGCFASTNKPVTLDTLKEVFHESCLQLEEKKAG